MSDAVIMSRYQSQAKILLFQKISTLQFFLSFNIPLLSPSGNFTVFYIFKSLVNKKTLTKDLPDFPLGIPPLDPNVTQL